MSTRYVWEKYNYTTEYEFIPQSSVAYNESFSTNYDDIVPGDYLYVNYSTSVNYTAPKTATLTGNITTKKIQVLADRGYYVSIPAGCYVIASINNAITADLSTIPGLSHIGYSPYGANNIMIHTTQNEEENDYFFVYFNMNVVKSIVGCSYTSTNVKGSNIGKSSSSSNSAYPDDGISGSYWYVYSGSDNIDPTAISYSTNSPKGGSAITIKVTARSNTYGGTIKYQYQVQLDSGSWTTLTTTASTSYKYTIPKGTNTFRARVRASDNYGFTSSTYVTGSTLTVINNTAPTISGSNSNLGSFSYLPPYIEYVINDADGNTVSVSIQLDSRSIYSGTAVLGKTEFIIFPDWDSLSSGSHTITITANDGQGGVTTRTYTFSKSVNTNLISREKWRRLNEGNVYDVIYFETAADIVTTNNGKYLRDRINAILSRVAVLKGTSATALAAMDSSIITERLHMKIDSGYNVKYLDTKSQYVKIGSQTVEDVLTQIESDIAALKG